MVSVEAVRRWGAVPGELDGMNDASLSPVPRRHRLSRFVTGRRGAWVTLLLSLTVFAAVFGAFRGAEAPAGTDTVPPGSESARVRELVALFPDADDRSVLIVAGSVDRAELDQAEFEAIDRIAQAAATATGSEAARAFPSEDGAAAMLLVPLPETAPDTDQHEIITALRAAVDAVPAPGLEVFVTGGPAFQADIAGAFAGADVTLLLVTLAIVAVLLILTYRSPVLWLIPITVVAIADRLAAVVTQALGQAFELRFDAGIISVLVFGAGTNYALLLISRAREELRVTEDHRLALARALRHTAPAVLASNLTVVLSLSALALAVLPSTRGLGITAAAGLVIALLAALGPLPAFLAVCGRGAFWPVIPRPSADATPAASAADAGVSGFWGRVAQRVLRRPARFLVGGLLLLAVLATGLFSTSVGLTQAEKFRVASPSQSGLTLLAEHFPAGEAQPLVVVASADSAAAVAQAATGVSGVVRAVPVAVTDSPAGRLARISVTGEPAPGTPESLELVQQVREAVHEVPGADAVVGGPLAEEADSRAGAARDLLVIAPVVLLIGFVVLVVLLRSLLAPALLLMINLLSAAAAIGAGSLLSRWFLGRDALDTQVPILAFLFLVALGVDYTIFLVHRAKREAERFGTVPGMIRAVASTGGVITSAGLVLAAVFAALGVLPLVTLGQLGLIVGLGVLVDTLLVRTVIVPALFGVLGDRVWWPALAPEGNNVAAVAPARPEAEGAQ